MSYKKQELLTLREHMGSQPVFEDIRLFRIFYLRSVSCVTNVASVSELTILDYPLKLEDTKGVIRSRKSKKGRQHNGQEKMDKQ